MPRLKGSKNIHTLSNINAENRTAVCASCGPVKIKLVPRPNGWKRGWKCKKQSNAWEVERKERKGWKFEDLGNSYCKNNKYRRHKKESCERCGFIPEDKCQLDVHHKDGNHENDTEENLQTLCANCHRYITHLSTVNQTSPING